MTVLYRKYRPTHLEDVVGQEQVTKTLANAIKQGKVGHAYLFIGPRGTGKTSVARIFAHAINDFNYEVEDHYLDIIEIDAASNTGVDNIRELREKAIIAPSVGKYKVYIIDEVHMLTKSASNALLKTLEEPPEHVIFIMATTDAYKVPITISSRTQVHTFKLATPEIMQTHLRKIADQEGIKITDDALKLVVRRGGGSFRDSLSLLDQVATLAVHDPHEGSVQSNTSDNTKTNTQVSEITAELLENALGLPQTQALTDLLQSFATQDTSKIHQLLKDLLNTGIKPETIASELISCIIEDPKPEFLPLLEKLPDIKDPFSEAKLLLAFLLNRRSETLGVAAPTSNPPAVATSTRVVSVSSETKSLPKSPESPLNAPKPTTPSNPAIRQNPPEIVPETPISTNSSVSTDKKLSIRDRITQKRAQNATGSDLSKKSRPTAVSSQTPSKIPYGDPLETAPTTPKSEPIMPTLKARLTLENFNWDNFLDRMKLENGAAYNQLHNADYEFDGETLHIYPSSKIAKNILEKPNYNESIRNCLGEIKLFIHPAGSKSYPEDSPLSKISDIMGGVQEIKGEMPF